MPLNNTFDLIVIGAGINGAGVARDAAMRGLKVLLVDKGDISAGTSSWSTRLIHGGLRYLEHGELGLVRESLREREILLRIAPHLVRPLPITIPIYKGGRRGRTTIRAGMIAYDLLSWNKSLPRHRMYSRHATLAQIPGLNSAGLLGSAKYFDAQVEFAERLVLENALSAQQHGASVITYAKVTKLRAVNERLLQVKFYASQREQIAVANIVVNAAGPWVDQLLNDSLNGQSHLIGGTKGTHLIVAPFAGAPAGAIYIEAESDGRPFFVIPWNGNYLIGTTDIRFEGDLDQVRGEDWEIDYLLAETNRALSEARLTRSRVHYVYSGVRPLPSTSEQEEAGITRRHFIREHATLTNLLSIVGGKLTTYRSLAEECVDLIFRKLQRSTPTCRTSTPLPGAESSSETTEFSNRVNTRLARIYGSRAGDLADLAKRDSSLARVFSLSGDAIAAEVVFAFEMENATTLADCLLRRTMLGLNSNLAIGDDVAAVKIAQEFLGWTDERAKEEVARYRKFVGRFQLP